MLERSNKTAFLLAWHFVAGNKWLHFRVVLFFLLLIVAGGVVTAVTTPFAIILFLAVIQIFVFGADYYFAQKIRQVSSPQQMRDLAGSTKFSQLLFGHMAEGSALTLAMGIFWLLYLAMIWAILSAAVGPSVQILLIDPFTATFAAGAYGLFVLCLLVTALFLYGVVGAYGCALRAGGGFGPTFKSAMRLFAPSFWRSILNKEYFRLVAGWELVLFGLLAVGRVLKFLLFVILAAPVAAKGLSVTDPEAVVTFSAALLLTEAVATLVRTVVRYFVSYYSTAVAVFAGELAIK